jgi:hypothetical protein
MIFFKKIKKNFVDALNIKNKPCFSMPSGMPMVNAIFLAREDLESKLMVSAIILARGDPESKLVP